MVWTEKNLKRSYRCTTELLKCFRECKGWTQSELAKAAGYSERLVSKAESGGDISTTAIADLAGALSSSTQTIYPEDLISDPVKLAKEYYTALETLGTGTFAAIRHFLEEDLVVKLSGDPAFLPFAGEYHGPAGFEQALSIFFSFLEPLANHDPRPWYSYMGNGTEVAVIGKSWIHPIGKPLDKPMPVVSHLKFRRGKLIYFDDHYDTYYGAKVMDTLPFDRDGTI